MWGNQLSVAMCPNSKFGQSRLVFAAGGINEAWFDNNVITRGKFGEHLRGEMRIWVIELVEIFNNMRGAGFHTLSFGVGTAAGTFCRVGCLVTYATDDEAQPAWRVYNNFRVRVSVRFHRRNFGHQIFLFRKLCLRDGGFRCVIGPTRPLQECFAELRSIRHKWSRRDY